MEEQRSKRAKATPCELGEPSSSRASNEGFRNLGNSDVPLIVPNPSSHSEDSAEGNHSSQRNPNISMLVAVEVERSSGQGEVSVSTDERDSVVSVQEDPRGPSADSGTSTYSPLRGNNSMAPMDEHGEASTDPETVSNTPLQRNPSPAEQGEAAADVDMPIETPIHRMPSTAAVDGHTEVPAERVLVEEGAVQVGAPRVADDGGGHGTDNIIAQNDMNSPRNVSNFGEEDAQADRADCVNCPICMEPWTGEGIHRICCLACGHLFGRSCIRRWLNQRGKKNGKCPHCNRKARVEDIRNLYVPSLTVIDDRSQQLLEELGLLQAKNKELVVQNDKLKRECGQLQAMLTVSHPVEMPRGTVGVSRGKSHQHHTFEEFGPLRPLIYLNDQAMRKENFFMKHSSNSLQERTRWESSAAGNQMRSHNSLPAHGIDTYGSQQVPMIHGNEFPKQFQLQEEFSLPGARVFDMDAFSQMLLVAQKPSAVGGSFCLNKLSLLSLSDALVMPLPQCTGAVRDIRVAPPGGKLPGRLALVASLGKVLSLFSLESNNVVLTYKLQSPCWSCAWDPNDPNFVFAGLQDGTFTIFDLRQTSSPLRSLQSCYRQPVHTLHPVNECNLPQGERRNGILSACSSGVCFWDSSMLGLHDSRPQAIPFTNNQSICVALAYNQLANVGVATFRAKSLVNQPLNHASEAESVESSIGLSSQANSQSSLGFHPLRGAHYPLVKSAGISSSTGSVLPCGEMSSNNCGWAYGSPMFGNVSPVGMHRSSIVFSSRPESPSDSQSVFAFGDEETRALILWDVRTLTMLDRLRAHSSPILDVRSMNIGEHAFLGCTSGATLQVYKR